MTRCAYHGPPEISHVITYFRNLNKKRGELSLVETRHVIIFNLQPLSKPGFPNCEINSSYRYHSLRIFKTILMVPSRRIYFTCTKSNLRKRRIITSTYFQKFSVNSQWKWKWWRSQGPGRWGECNDVLFCKVWWRFIPERSSLSELWNLTWIARFRGPEGTILVLLASVRFKEEEPKVNFKQEVV